MCNLVLLSTTSPLDLQLYDVPDLNLNFEPADPTEWSVAAANLSHSNLWSLSRFGCCGCHFRHRLKETSEPIFNVPFGDDNDDIAATLAVYSVINSLVASGAEVDLIDYWDQTAPEFETLRVQVSQTPPETFRFAENFLMNFVPWRSGKEYYRERKVSE